MPSSDYIKKLYHFTVEGRFDFPFDMLRYDSCWPRFESEITSLAPHHRSSQLKEVRQIQMTGLREPTEGRWQSFGWKVVEGSMSVHRL